MAGKWYLPSGFWLTEKQIIYILTNASSRTQMDKSLKFPRSWGDSGALYLQSALAGVMAGLGLF